MLARHAQMFWLTRRLPKKFVDRYQEVLRKVKLWIFGKSPNQSI